MANKKPCYICCDDNYLLNRDGVICALCSENTSSTEYLKYLYKCCYSIVRDNIK